MPLVASIAALGAGCVSAGAKITQSLVRGTAGPAEPTSEFADPPLAVEDDKISVSSTTFVVDVSFGLADVAEIDVGYGMVFPDVRAQKPEAPRTVAHADNEFADRFTVGATVGLLTLGKRGDGGRAPMQLRAYGEVGFAAITTGLFAAAGPNFAMEAGARITSERGFFVQAGLVWEKGGLGDEAGDYNATGLGFGFGYHYPWPGAGDRR